MKSYVYPYQPYDLVDKCPVCGKKVVYSMRYDRYFHIDGTTNQKCWMVILRGEVDGR